MTGLAALVLALALGGSALALQARRTTSSLARSRVAEARLAHLALHDDLTGLPNRTLARDRLGVALSNANRTGQRLALLHVDVDRLKQVNDAFGHQVGDQVLQGVAERLGRVVRPEDTVARVGGDEFLVICPGVDCDYEAHLVAGRVLQAMAAPLVIDGRELATSLSVGMSITTGSGSSVDQLLREAGGALDRAKRHGRDRITVIGAAPRDEAARAARDLDELRAGMEFGDLVMEYQPIVDLPTRTTVGFEALARWRHPERGLVVAGDFVPLLEASDLAVELARVSLGQACQTAAELRSEGRQVAMHVNLSLRQLEWDGAVDTVGRALDAAGLPPSGLTLEIGGPGSAMRTGTVDRIRALRDLGVRIAISIGADNAGFRHSAELPIDVLKLDRSIVTAADKGRSARAVGAGVLAMSHHLGIPAIAEGIETAAQEAALVGLGYSRAQGNRFSAALPRDRLTSRA